MSEKKQPVDLGLLEEDDEFEEFPAEGAGRGGDGTGRDGKRGSSSSSSACRPRPGPARSAEAGKGRSGSGERERGGGAGARFVSGSLPAEQPSGSPRRRDTTPHAPLRRYGGSFPVPRRSLPPVPPRSEVRGRSPVRVKSRGRARTCCLWPAGLVSRCRAHGTGSAVSLCEGAGNKRGRNLPHLSSRGENR